MPVHTQDHPRRLPSYLGVGIVVTALAGCDDAKKPEPVVRERSQGVVATTTAPGGTAPATAVTASSKPRAIAVSAPRREPLCQSALKEPPKPAPTAPLARQTKPGATPLPETLAIGKGRWTLVNLWAAWCVPCKEEVPLLQRWAQALAGKLDLVFVSLDDDRRQLEKFLDSQPRDGLTATYWLEEGKPRSKWLEPLGLPEDVALPVQILFDPKGEARCVVNGAVETGDFAALKGVVGG